VPTIYMVRGKRGTDTIYFSFLSCPHHLKSSTYRDNVKVAVLVQNGKAISMHIAAMMPILP